MVEELAESYTFEEFCSRCEERLGFESGDWISKASLIRDLGFDSLDWMELDYYMSGFGVDLYATPIDEDLTVDDLYNAYLGSCAATEHV